MIDVLKKCKYYWNFESSTDLVNNLSFSPSVTINSGYGKFGKGANSGQSCKTSEYLDLSVNGGFTINAWFKSYQANSLEFLFHFTTSGGQQFALCNYTNVKLFFYYQGHGYDFTQTGSGFNYNTWVYVSMVVDTNTHTFDVYVNGEKRNTSPVNYVVGSIPSDIFSNIKVDVYSQYSYTDELSIFDSKLTQSEINELYNNGNGTTYTLDSWSEVFDDVVAYYSMDETSGSTIVDSGKNKINGISVGGSIGEYSGIIGSCEYFGANTAQDTYSTFLKPKDYFSNKTAATISFWAKFPNFYNARLLDTGTLYSGWGNKNFIEIRLENEYLAVYGKAVNSSNQTFNISGISYRAYYMTANTWHHIVIRAPLNSGSWDLFVDGNIVGSMGLSLPGYTFYCDNNVIGTFSRANYTPRFNGYIDELGFWDRALSDTEISHLYNSGAGLPFESGPTYLVELTDGVGVTDDVETQTNYHVELQDYNYTTDSEDINQDTKISLRDNVSIGDNVKVKVDYKVNVQDGIESNDDQRVIVYKNGIDSIWTDRQKPTDTIWNNRPKPWIRN